MRTLVISTITLKWLRIQQLLSTFYFHLFILYIEVLTVLGDSVVYQGLCPWLTSSDKYFYWFLASNCFSYYYYFIVNYHPRGVFQLYVIYGYPQEYIFNNRSEEYMGCNYKDSLLHRYLSPCDIFSVIGGGGVNLGKRCWVIIWFCE